MSATVLLDHPYQREQLLASRALPRRLQRATLAIVCLATAMLMRDIAVVNTALPLIARDLHAGLSGVQ
jgi:hypothetical protein